MWYFTIYDWMVDELQLKGRELLIYAYLYSWKGKDTLPTQLQVAETLNIDASVLCRLIGKLRAAGLIDKKSIAALTKSQLKIDKKSIEKLTKSQSKIDKKSIDDCQKVNSTIHLHNQLHTITGTNTPERTHEYIITGIVDFYAERGQTYTPNWSTMTTAAAELDAKMVFLAKNKKIAPAADSLATLWTDFLDAAYAHADEWQRNHFTLDTLNSQFQVFINQITNGRQHINGSGGVSDDYIADAIRTAFGGAGSGAD